MLTPDARADLDLAQAYADGRRQRHDGRPWVVVNMISSLDGASALDGRSGSLGNAGDRAVFAVMRSLADVILVGAETVRAEHYGPPRAAGQHVAVVSRRGDLDLSSALFTSGAGFLVLPEDGPDVPVHSVRAGNGTVDLSTALPLLEGDVVLAEGGPSLNGALLAADLVDELCVTFAPVLAGGGSSRIVRGPEHATRLELAHVLEEDGYLYCRYLRA
ncbi:MAG TPA: dihydrofolate reductase family protein [Acidimicrobiales bacterium]|nr:dihydrofolate reductase family protein [Acidimicrobiales bacterium]